MFIITVIHTVVVQVVTVSVMVGQKWSTSDYKVNQTLCKLVNTFDIERKQVNPYKVIIANKIILLYATIFRSFVCLFVNGNKNSAHDDFHH